jgi:hypothetical protein
MTCLKRDCGAAGVYVWTGLQALRQIPSAAKAELLFAFYGTPEGVPLHLHVMPKIKRIRHYSADKRVADVEFSEDSLTVSLMDGRSISVPLAWYPRLLHATPAPRPGHSRRLRSKRTTKSAVAAPGRKKIRTN